MTVGLVESAVVAFQDITRRKQAEAELAEYRKHLEALGGRTNRRAERHQRAANHRGDRAARIGTKPASTHRVVGLR